MRHELEQQKNRAYRERNIVLAGLAKLLHDLPGNPYNVYVSYEENSEQGWRILLVIDNAKNGQMTWHFSDQEEILLTGISHEKHLQDVEYLYDGHNTTEKYERFFEMLKLSWSTSIMDIFE